MIPHRLPANDIDQCAADWAARIDGDPLSPQEEAVLYAWLGQDVRHRGALARAQAVLTSVSAKNVLNAPARATPFGGRRTVLMLVGAVAATILALTVLPQGADRDGQLYASEIGEVRTIPLADGTHITLNTNSAVHVSYDEERRQVRLVRGEAFFAVAKNKARPFIVIGGHSQVRTVGTAYSVGLGGDGTMEVLIAEGKVAVENAESAWRRRLKPVRALIPGFGSGNAVYLRAGQKAQVRQDGGGGDILVSVGSVSPDEVDRALLWRGGQIAFEGETLAAASVQFARYSRQRIVIRVPSLARARVSGLFRANDPEGFARAIALSLGARLSFEPGKIVLSR